MALVLWVAFSVFGQAMLVKSSMLLIPLGRRHFLLLLSRVNGTRPMGRIFCLRAGDAGEVVYAADPPWPTPFSLVAVKSQWHSSVLLLIPSLRWSPGPLLVWSMAG